MARTASQKAASRKVASTIRAEKADAKRNGPAKFAAMRGIGFDMSLSTDGLRDRLLALGFISKEAVKEFKVGHIAGSIVKLKGFKPNLTTGLEQAARNVLDKPVAKRTTGEARWYSNAGSAWSYLTKPLVDAGAIQMEEKRGGAREGNSTEGARAAKAAAKNAKATADAIIADAKAGAVKAKQSAPTDTQLIKGKPTSIPAKSIPELVEYVPLTMGTMLAVVEKSMRETKKNATLADLHKAIVEAKKVLDKAVAELAIEPVA